MKFIYSLLIAVSSLILFSACGGGGGGGGTTSDNEIIACSATTNIPDGYTTLESGDTITNLTSGTVISFFHSSGGDKKVCVVSGSAVIN